MSAADPRPEPKPEPELEALLRRLEPPRAREEFRAQLARRFVAAEALEPAPSAPRVARLAPPRPGARQRAATWAAAALLAAACVLLVLRLRPSAGPEALGDGLAWRVAVLDGPVEVDGVRFGPEQASELERALAGASRVVPVRAALVLRAGDRLLLEAAAGTQLELAAARPRDSKLSSPPGLVLGARAGSLALVTGPAFRDGLCVLTPDLELGVVGTAFAVDVEPEGTCVCGAEGEVEVHARAADCSHPVRSGGMAFESADGRPCAVGPAHEEHLAPLRALVRRAEELWGPRAR